ncbi:flippase-like domain-containing protein [Candidatus Bathyarchaeota archaeon]|nr:flippase-like domain-containing protein [Candidatus Bathyarchaeota archaeon]
MVSVKPKATWKTVLLPLLGIIAFFIYLYLFNIDIPTIIALAGTTNLNIYLLAIVFVILDTFFFSLAWHFLLNFLSVKLSVLKSFLYVWYGVFMDLIIPAESISAEISKIYLVTREQSGSETSGKVVASLVIQRLMGMGLNIIGLLVGASILLTQMQVGGVVLNLTLFLAVASIVFLILLIFFCAHKTWTMKVIDAAIRFLDYISRRRWKLEKARKDVIEAANIFHDSMNQFRRAPKTVLTSLFFNAVAWLLSIGVAYLVFLSIGFEVHWGIIIITYSIVSAIQGIPLGIPFEAGLPEITMTALYAFLGIPYLISATATILTRILTVWLRFFIGFIVQQGLEIKTLTKPKTSNQVSKT